jgi:hypothetical protein
VYYREGTPTTYWEKRNPEEPKKKKKKKKKNRISS